MNTNETQEIEIPAEWDVTVQATERQGIRIGIEKMRDGLKQWARESSISGLLSTFDIIMIADQLLAEQGEKG